MRSRILCLLAAVVAFSSCSILKVSSVEQEYNEVWKDRTYTEIVMEFGAPDRVESDGNGGNILIYEKVSTTATTDVDTHFGNFDPDYTTKVQTHKSYVHFYVGPDHMCYLVKSNKVAFDIQDEKKAKTTLKVCAGVWGTAVLVLPLLFLL